MDEQKAVGFVTGDGFSALYGHKPLKPGTLLYAAPVAPQPAVLNPPPEELMTFEAWHMAIGGLILEYGDACIEAARPLRPMDSAAAKSDRDRALDAILAHARKRIRP